MPDGIYDCIVIGGGAVGALTLRAVTAKGAKGLLLEAGALSLIHIYMVSGVLRRCMADRRFTGIMISAEFNPQN